MDYMISENKSNRLTFIGFLFVLYYCVLACNNQRIVLYGGFITISGLIVLDKFMSAERMKIEFPKACKMLYYFTVFCYFSRIWAWDEALVVSNAFFLIPVMLLMLISVNYFIKIQSAKACIYTILYSGLALSVYVIVKNGGFSAFYRLATETGNRIGSGGNMNVNSIGMICAYTVVTLLYYAIIRKKKFCYLVMVLPFMTSVASGSRKSIILMVVGLLMLIILSQKNKRGIFKIIKVLFLLLICFFILKLLLTLDIMSTVNERMEGLMAALTENSGQADSSALARKNLLSVGIEQFKQTPFIGVGFGNSYIVAFNRMGLYVYSHNDYVEHLINGGIVSLLLYYGTVLFLLKRHIRLMRHNNSPELILSLTIIVMYLVSSAACVTYYDDMTTYLYFTLWISEVAIHEKKQREKVLNESNEKNDQNGGF